MTIGINILKKENSISILKKIVVVNNLSQMPLRLSPFHFTAEEGQVIFELDRIPQLIIWCAIQGTIQSQANGDFTVANNILTLNSGASAGDTVYGVYQY